MFFTSRKQIPQALTLLEEAIVRDPRYGLALAFAACCYMNLVSDDTPDREDNRREGIEAARRAL